MMDWFWGLGVFTKWGTATEVCCVECQATVTETMRCTDCGG